MGRSNGSVLIAAVSGRALARAAVAAGYTPLVADFFADQDCRALASATEKVEGDTARGFQWDSLAPVLEQLTAKAPSPPLGLVYGSGFEDRPNLLDRLAKRWPLLGNDASTVARINDPAAFFSSLETAGIPHPQIRLSLPEDPTGWLEKRAGGAGGSHVLPASSRPKHDCSYFQVRAEGRTVSALFAAAQGRATVLGFSEQWTAPGPGKTWRHGGAAQPALISDAAAINMTKAVSKLAAAFPLQGLNAADFLLQGDSPLLLEVNPRPGATLDIFAGLSPALFDIHLAAATRGELPQGPLATERAQASATVFAPRPVVIPPGQNWPDWVADQPNPGERIDKERPICTVLARAGTVEEARDLVLLRARTLRDVLQEDGPADLA